MEDSEEEEITEADENTFRILIVTDTHLGVFEKDPIRSKDSFRALDEALEIGRKYKCDFVLHGGDLFEHNNPSKNTMVKAIELLRKHTVGNQPIKFQVVSDQSKNFVSGRVNFEDKNFNVGFPIFMIHGNHDDPSGYGQQSALNILSSAGLINYFGRVDNVEDIKCFPILMQKGTTKLALYGMGNIRDERLHRAFSSQKVQWIRPKGEKKEWFNLFTIHQNRTAHSKIDKNYVPEDVLPKFLDLVYWAHEHECLIELTESLSSNFYVTQPGSPIVTSLSAADARPKYVGIMDIRGDACKVKPVRLKRTRPFVWSEIVLNDQFERDVEMEDIEKYLIDRVHISINKALGKNVPREAKEVLTEEEINSLPLIRIRVDHTGFQRLNSSRFGQRFVNKVANPEEILLCHKKASRSAQQRKRIPGIDLADYDAEAKPIKEIIYDMLHASTTTLGVLPEVELTEAVEEFVQKQNGNAIEDFVRKKLKEVQEELMKNESLKIKEDVERYCFEVAEKKRAKFNQTVAERHRVEAEEKAAKMERKRRLEQEEQRRSEPPKKKPKFFGKKKKKKEKKRNLNWD